MYIYKYIYIYIYIYIFVYVCVFVCVRSVCVHAGVVRCRTLNFSEDDFRTKVIQCRTVKTLFIIE